MGDIQGTYFFTSSLFSFLLFSSFPSFLFLPLKLYEQKKEKTKLISVRYAVGYSDHLEKHVVASKHLKSWLVQRGVPEQQISVVYIGISSYICYLLYLLCLLYIAHQTCGVFKSNIFLTIFILNNY